MKLVAILHTIFFESCFIYSSTITHYHGYHYYILECDSTLSTPSRPSKEPLPGPMPHVCNIPELLTDLELFRRFCLPIRDMWDKAYVGQSWMTFSNSFVYMYVYIYIEFIYIYTYEYMHNLLDTVLFRKIVTDQSTYIAPNP